MDIFDLIERQKSVTEKLVAQDFGEDLRFIWSHGPFYFFRIAPQDLPVIEYRGKIMTDPSYFEVNDETLVVRLERRIISEHAVYSSPLEYQMWMGSRLCYCN